MPILSMFILEKNSVFLRDGKSGKCLLSEMRNIFFFANLGSWNQSQPDDWVSCKNYKNSATYRYLILCNTRGVFFKLKILILFIIT